MSLPPPEAEPADFPVDGPASVDAVKAYPPAITDDRDDEHLAVIVAAVNRLIRRLPIAQESRGAESWPADVVLGALMLCKRLQKRKGSPAGVEAFGGDGVAYIQRHDPDVSMLLQLGPAWSKPAVG